MATQPKDPVPEVLAAEMAKDREQRREERQALVAIPAADLTAAPLRTSFMPQSMGEAMQLATIMARSTFVPGHCRGSEGNCLAIIMQAGRWGMDPFAVANKAYFVKEGAPPAFEAQLVNAVVNSSGALSGRLRIEFEGEGEKLRCTVRGFLRADPNEEKARTQSIARITVRNSPLWKSDPEQQLGYYTTRAWARMHCPEVLLGVYTPDEIEIEPERARVVSPALPRRSDTRAEMVDEDTGEVIETDARGMTVVDEETARALDAGDQGEGPAQEQRGESQTEQQADHVGPTAPQNPARNTTWFNPETGQLKYAHDKGAHGVKWYLEPQEDPQLEAQRQQAEAAAETVQQVDGPLEQQEPEPPYAAKVRDLIAAIEGAVNKTALKKAEDEYLKHVVALPQEAADPIDALIMKRRREFAAVPAEGSGQ